MVNIDPIPPETRRSMERAAKAMTQQFTTSPAMKRQLEQLAAMSPETKRAFQEGASKIAADTDRLQQIFKDANFTFAAQRSELINVFKKQDAQMAAKLAASVAPLGTKYQEMFEKLGRAAIPSISIQHAFIKASTGSKATLGISEELRRVVEQASELDAENPGDVELQPEAEMQIIEALIADDSADNLVAPETKRLWSTLTQKQKRRAARLFALVFNAIGGICLTLIGQPWLAALLTAVVNAVAGTVSDRIETGSPKDNEH